MPLKEHLNPVREWWNNRQEGHDAYKVSIVDIKAKGWSLHFPNPHKPKEAEGATVDELLNDLSAAKDTIDTTLAQLRGLLS